MMVTQPSISVNKLAEYIGSKGARQRKILIDRKYPDEEFRSGMFHREASEAASLYLAGGAIDTSPIENRIKALSQLTPTKVGTARRINANIDALERLSEMLDDINLLGAEPSLGSNQAPSMTFNNVKVSVRPEIILRGVGPKSKPYVGAMKLHFSRSHPLNDEAAGYVSAVVQEWCKLHLVQDNEVVNPLYCQVVDVGSGKVYPGVKSTSQRLKDVAAECQNIAALWPTI